MEVIRSTGEPRHLSVPSNGRHRTPTSSLSLAGCLLMVAVIPATAQQICSAEWSLVEEITIGSVDGPDAMTPFRSVAIGPEGEIYIPQPMAGVVSVFAPDGRLLRSFGRSGSGPGDFESGPRTARWMDGQLWISDRFRAQSFTDDGRPDAFVTFQHFERHEGVILRPAVPLADGSMLAGQGMTPVPHPLATLPVRRFARNGRVLDTIATLDVTDDRVILDERGGFALHPLRELLPGSTANRLPLSLNAEGSELVLLGAVRAGGRTPTFDLLRISIAGDTVMQRSIRYDPKPIPRDERAWWRDHFAAFIAGDNTPDNSRAAPTTERTRARKRRQAREALQLPRTYPPVRQVIAGADGTIWVLREPNLPSLVNEWEVYSETGALLGRILDDAGTNPLLRWLPKLEIVRATAEEVWATSSDELDVSYLHRYSVNRGC